MGISYPIWNLRLQDVEIELCASDDLSNEAVLSIPIRQTQPMATDSKNSLRPTPNCQRAVFSWSCAREPQGTQDRDDSSTESR